VFESWLLVSMSDWNDEFIFQSGKLTISLSRLHYIFSEKRFI
jgi:hypothetical protein